MTDKRTEALKLALEALEMVNRTDLSQVNLAIAALREALAQDVPEVGFGNMALDKMAENARELGLDYEPVWDNLPSNKDVEDAMRLKRLSQLAEQKSGIKQVIELYDSPEQPSGGATSSHQKPFGYIKPGEGDYEKVFSWNYNERNGYTQPVYTSPPAQRKPLTDEICNAFLQGIRYAANKYEAVSDERFTGGDVSNFLLMEAEELDSSDIAKAIKAAHGIKEQP